MATQVYPLAGFKTTPIWGLFKSAAPALVDGDLYPARENSAGVLLVDTTGSLPTGLPATYSLGFDGIAFGSAGGNFLELSNPAASGKVIRVFLQRLVKPSALIRWKINKQSSVDAGGTSTTPTPVPLDSNNAAAVGIVKLYTVVPATPGTIVGAIWDDKASGGDILEDDPGDNTYPTQPVVLRAGESVAWNADVAVTFQGTIRWTEAAA